MGESGLGRKERGGRVEERGGRRGKEGGIGGRKGEGGIGIDHFLHILIGPGALGPKSIVRGVGAGLGLGLEPGRARGPGPKARGPGSLHLYLSYDRVSSVMVEHFFRNPSKMPQKRPRHPPDPQDSPKKCQRPP